MIAGSPVATSERIEALDVLRGVALLGILLMNILGFGLHSAGYFNPLVGTDPASSSHAINMALWVFFDVTVEGAMRGLFSLLFGASVVLFTTGTGAKSRGLHYRRQWWLLGFGLVNGFVLLWPGDVLLTYALAGMLLYPLRAVRARKLLLGAAGIAVLMAAIGAVSVFGLSELREEAESALAVEGGQSAAAEWHDFAAGMTPTEEQIAAELSVRRGGYLEIARWNVGVMVETLAFVVPVFMLWDALFMMLIGMALMRLGLLSGARSSSIYWWMLGLGGLLGLLINGLEVNQRSADGYTALALFTYFYPTYNLGRLATTLAWLALVMLLCQWSQPAAWWQALRARLAAIGRTALTNYLLQSVFGLFIFTGAGLGLVGWLERWQLYLVVIAIWCVQLTLAPLWLRRYRYGPVEWLWRWLTYGRKPPLRR